MHRFKISAIIPAKGNSVRVPSKNMQRLGDETLLERKIRQLKSVSIVQDVIVGSDCDTLLQLAQNMGAMALKRTAYHCDETLSSANEMIVDLCERVDADIVLWAHCTNPFVEAEDYTRALNRYFEATQKGYDSLMSVTKYQSHFWTHEFKPYNFMPLSNPHPFASTLNPIYAQDGAIFIQPRQQMIDCKYFYGKNPYFFELSVMVGWDINTEEDLKLARALIKSTHS